MSIYTHRHSDGMISVLCFDERSDGHKEAWIVERLTDGDLEGRNPITEDLLADYDYYVFDSWSVIYGRLLDDARSSSYWQKVDDE